MSRRGKLEYPGCRRVAASTCMTPARDHAHRGSARNVSTRACDYRSSAEDKELALCERAACLVDPATLASCRSKERETVRACTHARTHPATLKGSTLACILACKKEASLIPQAPSFRCASRRESWQRARCRLSKAQLRRGTLEGRGRALRARVAGHHRPLDSRPPGDDSTE